ncbi:hypothetical protein [Quadrisphaera setariae]|uniref:Uncharacterized protein n=1 Tax=Quadrisphaera setariae TaxID=2593304 RepID=A0A5C8ZH25_9ACTN|nr:hypothetical protein [Quadrisphaera setariae]TXR56471.1 hypothetical protein FMM08_10310 [Quadrisphaera setariae]
MSTNTTALPDANDIAIALATRARTAGNDPAPVLALLGTYLDERPSDDDRRNLMFELVAVQAHAMGTAGDLLDAIHAAQQDDGGAL